MFPSTPYTCPQDTRASKGLLEEHYQKRHMQRMPRPRGQGPGPPGAMASPEPPPLGPWAAGAPRLPQLGGPNMDLPSPDVFSHPSPAFRQRLCPDPALFRPVAAMLARPVNLQFATQVQFHCSYTLLHCPSTLLHCSSTSAPNPPPPPLLLHPPQTTPGRGQVDQTH